MRTWSGRKGDSLWRAFLGGGGGLCWPRRRKYSLREEDIYLLLPVFIVGARGREEGGGEKGEGAKREMERGWGSGWSGSRVGEGKGRERRE